MKDKDRKAAKPEKTEDAVLNIEDLANVHGGSGLQESIITNETTDVSQDTKDNV